MPLDFPASPSLNDTYTFNGRTWRWNGTGWQLESPQLGTSGITDSAVTTAKIANSAVTTEKVNDGAITPAKLSTGGPSWDGSGNHTFGGGGTFSGDVTLSGTARRFLADNSNGTVSNRFAFQTTTSNSATIVNALPSGTGTAAGFLATNNATPTNAGYAALLMGSGGATLESGRYGSGTYQPLLFSVNGAEAARIDTSGRLLVGTSSTSGMQTGTRHVFNDGSGAAYTGVSVGNPGGALDNTDLNITSWSGAGSNYFTSKIRQTGAGSLTFHTQASSSADGAGSPTETLRITSDKYLRMAASTGGIQFNGDTASANALDDYEEGTFTPTLSSGGTSITYTDQIGVYTKIGRLVLFKIYLKINTVTPAAAGIQFGGLPFSAAAPYGATFAFNNGFDTNTGDTLYIDGTTITVYNNAGAARNGNASGVTLTSFLHLSGSYSV